MPKINLYEHDLTTPGGSSRSNNIVYVPGFAKYMKEKYRNKSKYPETYITWPHVFNTVPEFLEVFSSEDTKDLKGKFEYIRFSENKVSDNNGHQIKLVVCERSMQYALSLLSIGLPVLYDLITYTENNKVTEQDLIDKLTYKPSNGSGTEEKAHIVKRIELLKDRTNYDVKFITTGGYYLKDIINDINDVMVNVAATRGDCVALIDHEELINKTYNLKSSIFTNDNNLNAKFGAMFTPWCTFQMPSYEVFDNSSTITRLSSINMPGSLAYLLAFGTSVSNNNANWLAAAGASRGNIPYLKAPLVQLTEADIDSYQERTGISINPIANISPYGVIVWGNRTLNNNASGLIASSFLNIRQLCNDIKKELYTTCKYLTFEPNSDFLWVKFKSMITPLLDKMQSGDGISGYQIAKKKSAQKATLTAVIRIYPVEAVEDFEITLELADEATSVIDNLQ